MRRRKNTGTTDKLSKPQQVALDKIARRSHAHNKEWVQTGDIDPRPLKLLEGAHLIVQQQTGDSRSARITARGWSHLGQTPPDFGTRPPAFPGPSDTELEAALRPTQEGIEAAPHDDFKPMEKTSPHEHPGNGRPFKGPYPSRVQPSGVVSLVKPDPAYRDDTPRLSEPQPPDVDQHAPDGLKRDQVRRQHAAAARSTSQDAGCPDCIHEEVLTLVAAMHPEIADEVEILLRVKDVERDLERRGLLKRGLNGRTS